MVYLKNLDKEEKKRKLNADVQHIVDNLLKILPSKPMAILLCGGYGRNEGAWYKENGVLSTYNDYDFVVITNDVPNPNEIDLFRKKMASEVGINWVDLDFCTKKKLKHLKSTIKSYDLLYGSSLVFGKIDFSDLEKKIKAEYIGEEDLIKLYRTRIWTFLGAWIGPFRDLDIVEARFFKNQMAKAILAAVDMFLIKQKKYTSSYCERASIVLQLFPNDNDLCKLVEWAINEKLYPSSLSMKKKDMMELYFDAKDLFLKAFGTALNDKAKFFFAPDKTIDYFKKYNQHYLRLLYEKFVNPQYKYRKIISIFLAQNYVFHALCKTEVNQEFLDKSFKILKKYGYIDENTNFDIHLIRELTAYARNNL